MCCKLTKFIPRIPEHLARAAVGDVTAIALTDIALNLRASRTVSKD